METLIVFALAACVVFLIGGWGLSGWQVHRANKADNTIASKIESTALSYWFNLSDEEQKKLISLSTLVEQELFVVETASADVMMKATAENIIISLANQQYLLLGLGTPQRLSSATDFITVPKRLSFKEKQQKVRSTLLLQELESSKKKSPLRRAFYRRTQKV